MRDPNITAAIRRQGGRAWSGVWSHGVAHKNMKRAQVHCHGGSGWAGRRCPCGAAVSLYKTFRFANCRRDRRITAAHVFGKRCVENGIEHRLANVYHLRTNGQMEPIRLILGTATVKRCFCVMRERFREHPGTLLSDCNFAKRPRTLRGGTSIADIMNWWRNESERDILESR